MKSSSRLVFLLALAGTVASAPAHAIFVNGGFEDNSFQGWTIGGGINPGLSGSPPFTRASIQISGSNPGPASIVGAGTTDPRAPQLVLPRVGSYTAKVNDEATGARLTTMVQTDTLTNTDIDPDDGLPHIRFSFAPVLQDPGHTPNQQPYFYVSMVNTADNSVLFEQFSFAGEPTVPYINDFSNWKYLPFQNVDATLPMDAIGEDIELTVIAADCSPTAHGGYVYVDGFGSAKVPPQGPDGPPPLPALPVPTLDRFGLGLLALLFLFAAVRLRRFA